MDFFNFGFWQNFVSNSLATVVGVVLGIPAALWINRWISNIEDQKERDRQKEIKAERCKDLLRLLRGALEKNQKLLEQMEREIRPDYVIFYNVDTQLLDATSSLKYEIIENLELNQLLDSIRYELLHLHRKVDLQLEITYSAFQAISSYEESRKRLVEAILAHIPNIKSEIDEALRMIDAELNSCARA